MVIFNSYVKLPEGKAVVNTVCDGLILWIMAEHTMLYH